MSISKLMGCEQNEDLFDAFKGTAGLMRPLAVDRSLVFTFLCIILS